MNTPICDFVHSYTDKNPLRLHMPGHKGEYLTGLEKYDITEIPGADSLYEAAGIIKESEDNASLLFGSKTLYSAEGSSLSIRAMLYLTCLYAKEKGEKPLVFAGRNVHKVFLSSAALLDFEVDWIYPEGKSSYLSCMITAEQLDRKICSASRKPTAVYVTSPDYLGNEIDIRSLAEVCKNHGVLLLVDNAHGAYLKFLPESRHPIDLGADICCDSAHKTLPVVTGGAYLHISVDAPEIFKFRAKDALALFGSTSPSYLILQSLDAVNKYIYEGYTERLSEFILRVDLLKEQLTIHGYDVCKTEELKITVRTKAYGYTGNEFAVLLAEKGIFCEYSDPDFIVMMLTPELEDRMGEVLNGFLSVPAKEALYTELPVLNKPTKACNIREAYFCMSKEIDIMNAVGETLAVSDVSCPPAVPILVSGELIDDNSKKVFEYYGIKKCKVILK